MMFKRARFRCPASPLECRTCRIPNRSLAITTIISTPVFLRSKENTSHRQNEALNAPGRCEALYNQQRRLGWLSHDPVRHRHRRLHYRCRKYLLARIQRSSTSGRKARPTIIVARARSMAVSRVGSCSACRCQWHQVQPPQMEH